MTTRVRRVLTATVVLALVLGACGTAPVQTPPATSTPSPLPTTTPSESLTPAPPTQPTTASPVPPTPTPVAIIAPTATPVPSGPIVGRMAAVIADTRLVVRSAPGTSPDSTLLAWRLYPGQRVRVEEGPVLASGYPWYRVRVGQIEGWVAVASRTGEPWLAPVFNGMIGFSGNGASVSIINLDGSGERQLIDSVDSLTGTIEPGIRLASQRVVSASPVCSIGVGRPVAWSPDGTHLLVAADEGDCGRIFQFNADGSGGAFLAEGLNPAWSPDGGSIAFDLGYFYLQEACDLGEYAYGPWEIQIIPASGGKARSLTHNAACFYASAPSWSPDGSRIAFTGNDLSRIDLARFQDRRGIYIIRVDGTGQQRLADGYGPLWSPDGTRIMHTSAEPGRAIEVINPDGTGRATLVDGIGLDWSPDGTRIAYVVPLPDGSAATWVMNLIGSAQTKLVDSRVSVDWSPDGTQIVFGTGSGRDPGQIVIADADGTGARVLSEGCCPVWQAIVVR